MSTTPPYIEITQHAVDRYLKTTLVDGSCHNSDDARREIRELARSGTSTAPPSWIPAVEFPTGDPRQYLTVGPHKALAVSKSRSTTDDRNGIVVLSVIARPSLELGGG